MTGFDLAHRLRGWRGLVLAAFVALVAGLPSLMLLPPLDRDEMTALMEADDGR